MRASISRDGARPPETRSAARRAASPSRAAADLVEIPHLGWLDRRHRQSSLADLDGQPLPLEQLQGVADRLARNRKPLGDLLLRESLARGKRAIGDGVDQPQMDLLDQVRNEGQRFH